MSRAYFLLMRRTGGGPLIRAFQCRCGQFTMHVPDGDAVCPGCNTRWMVAPPKHSSGRDMGQASGTDNPRGGATHKLSRSDVRAVDCPACGAKAGDKCVGVRDKPRESNHRERVRRAALMGGGGSIPCL